MNSLQNTRTRDLLQAIMKTVAAIVLLIIIVYLAKRFLQTELEAGGQLFIQKFGLAGLFLDVYLVDTFIVPATPDFFLGILVASGKYQMWGVVLICVASVLGGLSGYWIGSRFGRWKWVQRAVHSYQQRGEHLFQRFGVGAVILAAISPLPFSTVCWLAGIFRMNFNKFALATLGRIPRMILWYYLIAYVWQNS